jgi:Ca2+-binding EF-hand superfamily protein
MVRDVLRVKPTDMNERELQGMWRWIDHDVNGVISVGEFVRLMKRGT